MNKCKRKLNVTSGHITILVRTLTSSLTQTLTLNLTHFYLKLSLYPQSGEDKLDCASDRCLLVLIMSDL